MTTDELTAEKRIANELPHPPVHPEATLNSSGPVEILGHPPQTRLLLEGLDPEEITADFLVGIHDLADDHGRSVESISVCQRGW